MVTAKLGEDDEAMLENQNFIRFVMTILKKETENVMADEPRREEQHQKFFEAS